MSNVHDDIALKAFRTLPPEMRKQFTPFLDNLKESSWYPDYFADRTMSQEEKAKIDPDADRFIYPDQPESDWYKKIIAVTEHDMAFTGAPPLRMVHLIEHYLDRAIASISAGNMQHTIKYFGVLSHVIGDTVEPIHAVDPRVIDFVLPPPKKFLGLELHANVEKLSARVDLKDYRPVLLGKNREQILMGTYARLAAAHSLGASLALPIVQALYAGNRKKAVLLSQKAQNTSARLFADFMYSVLELHDNIDRTDGSLDLAVYPFVRVAMDMLYRYRPAVDISLIPYSGGKYHPLSIVHNKKIEKVHGIGVVGLMAPPFTADRVREAVIEYMIIPGAYRTFRSLVGLNPLFKDALCGAVFSVTGDGKELVRSGTIKPGDDSELITADITNVRWLTLAMRYTNNPCFEDVKRLHCAWASHGVWAEPTLTA
jgi:hypothetical protein